MVECFQCYPNLLYSEGLYGLLSKHTCIVYLVFWESKSTISCNLDNYRSLLIYSTILFEYDCQKQHSFSKSNYSLWLFYKFCNKNVFYESMMIPMCPSCHLHICYKS